MVSTRRRSWSPAIGAALVLVVGLACNDIEGPDAGDIHEEDPSLPQAPGAPAPDGPGRGSPGAPSPGLTGLVVSNPTDETVYISLPPGSVPNGRVMTMRNRRNGSEDSATFVAGGFDPFSLPGLAGDTIDLRLYLDGTSAPAELTEIVPARRAPVIVRVEPPAGAQSVPLDVVPLVVFSEAVDPARIDTTTVRLERAGTSVAGPLAADHPYTIVARFTPATPLAAESPYSLVVTGAIADLDGDLLETGLTATFTTGPDPNAPIVATFDRITPWSFELTEPRLDLRVNGRFTFSYAYAAGYAGIGFAGAYQATADGYVFTFDDGSQADPWLAVGTLVGDSLLIEFNLAMRQATPLEGQVGFEDGVYLRTGSSPPMAPPLAGRIAFAAELTGADGQYVFVTGAGGINALTRGRNPSWSPDGRRLAFTRWPEIGEPGGIYVIDDDGSHLTRIAETGDEPDWSPDGARIVYVDTAGIRVVDVDGSGATTVLHHGTQPGWTWATAPAWSPDGRQIAFSVIREPDFWFTPDIGGVYLMNADGSDIHTLTGESGCGKTTPAWSPDGSEIAMSACGYVAVYAADGSAHHWLTKGAFPTWSPDGRWLAMFAGADIALVDLGGGPPLKLIPNARSYYYGAGVFSWTAFE